MLVVWVACQAPRDALGYLFGERIGHFPVLEGHQIIEDEGFITQIRSIGVGEFSILLDCDAGAADNFVGCPFDSCVRIGSGQQPSIQVFQCCAVRSL